ncbi:MAG: PPOX class F420-dependent oxidoreductase [Anaerolineales bacterium]|jgi:PPOX class probable F420-dependent enzyme|nr:PPOX class F420-dependent oxidoreductase [Anaerolineales bacterium]
MTLKMIPSSHEDLLADDTRAIGYLATIMSDRSAQVTPVWFNTDGEYILINSAKGRVKDRNMRARPKVAIAISDPINPYRYLQVRGEVVEITDVGGEDHIHTLAGKYLGDPIYKDLKPGDIRVTYKISPTSVTIMG